MMPSMVASVPLILLFGILLQSTGILADQELPVVEIPNVIPTIALDIDRSLRFPSKEERVKIYMSNWYLPPCDDYMDGFVRYRKSETSRTEREDWPTYMIHESNDMISNSTKIYEIESKILPDKIFWVHSGTIIDCGVRGKGETIYKERILFRSNMHMYCEDVVRLLLPANDHIAWEHAQYDTFALPEDYPPILMQFGDLPHSHDYRFVSFPHFKKFRQAATPAELNGAVNNDEMIKKAKYCYDNARQRLKSDTPYQPIVWKLASHRHYGLLDQVSIKDKSWDEKKNMAVFRGQLTGSLGYDKDASPLSNCLKLSRCRLVYNHGNSTLVNALLTSTRGRLPDSINGVKLTTSSVTIRHLLRYKGIVMLEGNDVASGLKWALLSNSVVLMPIPKHTSWAMEERLIPWIHYIPLNDEATDVEEKMQWILEHEGCQAYIICRNFVDARFSISPRCHRRRSLDSRGNDKEISHAF
jgi:Glycosyl transferase family 90